VPSWLTEALKLLGFTTPFVYAAATYGVFHWLDKKASGPAKRALTARLQSAAPEKNAVTGFTVEVFDRIYSAPLASWRAFLRSAAITTILCAVTWFQTGLLPEALEDADRYFSFSLIGYSLLINIIIDFASLFFVRPLLMLARFRPVQGLLLSFIIGIIIVWAGYFTRGIITAAYIFIWDAPPFQMPFFPAVWRAYGNPLQMLDVDVYTLLPAVVVHLWLPLLAVAIIMTRAAGWFSKAVGWMQWFLRQGQHHPFQAVGYVASVIVFASSAVIQYMWR
jgi:hypothetical protein